MGERGIPRHVRAFITGHLKSVAQLEILLLLHQAAGEPVETADVAETLRIDPTWAGEELRGLSEDGLLVRQDAEQYCYRPRTTDLAAAVDGLAKSFATHRVSVITLLFSSPREGVGSFADAFKIRKDDDDG